MTVPRMETGFELPVRPAEIPGTLDRGDAQALQLVDGFIRGVSLLGRFFRSPGLIGLKVAPPSSGPVRITLTLGYDGATVSWWDDRVPDAVQPRMHTAPRLLLVRAQGDTRTAVVLARRGTTAGVATVSFEVDATELDPDGLLTIELADPAAPPAWVSEAAAPFGAVGVRLDSVSMSTDVVEPAGPQVTPAGLIVIGPESAGASSWQLRAALAGDAGGAGASAAGTGRTPPPFGLGSAIPRGRPLPPPEPRTRVGRWMSGLKGRLQAEARLDGLRHERGERPELEVSGQMHREVKVTPAGHRDGRAPVGPEAVLDDLLRGLVREKRLRVRALGLLTGAETRLPVSYTGRVVEIGAPGTSSGEPLFIRIDAVEDELFSAPELRQHHVEWRLVG